jgi:hypothetical protein
MMEKLKQLTQKLLELSYSLLLCFAQMEHQGSTFLSFCNKRTYEGHLCGYCLLNMTMIKSAIYIIYTSLRARLPSVLIIVMVISLTPCAA